MRKTLNAIRNTLLALFWLGILIIGFFFLTVFIKLAAEIPGFLLYYGGRWQETGLALWKIILFHFILISGAAGFYAMSLSSRLNGPRTDAARQADAIINTIQNQPPH